MAGRGKNNKGNKVKGNNTSAAPAKTTGITISEEDAQGIIDQAREDAKTASQEVLDEIEDKRTELEDQMDGFETKQFELEAREAQLASKEKK